MAYGLGVSCVRKLEHIYDSRMFTQVSGKDWGGPDLLPLFAEVKKRLRTSRLNVETQEFGFVHVIFAGLTRHLSAAIHWVVGYIDL